jgi:Acetyltransferase (GNAT) family
MLIVRKVETKDAASIVEFGRAFYETTVFNELINFDAISLLHTIFSNIDNPCFNCWVAELDGKVIGAIAGYSYMFQYNLSDLVIMELFWHVNSKYRSSGAGEALHKQFENWGKEIGAVAIQMGYTSSCESERVEKIYKRKGFVENGKIYIKRLNYE